MKFSIAVSGVFIKRHDAPIQNDNRWGVKFSPVSYIIILRSILDTAESHQQKIISLLISGAAVECLLGVGKLGRSL